MLKKKICHFKCWYKNAVVISNQTESKKKKHLQHHLTVLANWKQKPNLLLLVIELFSLILQNLRNSYPLRLLPKDRKRLLKLTIYKLSLSLKILPSASKESSPIQQMSSPRNNYRQSHLTSETPLSKQ